MQHLEALLQQCHKWLETARQVEGQTEAQNDECHSLDRLASILNQEEGGSDSLVKTSL